MMGEGESTDSVSESGSLPMSDPSSVNSCMLATVVSTTLDAQTVWRVVQDLAAEPARVWAVRLGRRDDLTVGTELTEVSVE